MVDDEGTEAHEGPRRKTYAPPPPDAVFTGAFPILSDEDPPAIALQPPQIVTPSAATAAPVRTSLGDAEIIAAFESGAAGTTGEMIAQLQIQVALREEEEEAFEMWANLTRATRGVHADAIIARERVIFDGGTPEPEVAVREVHEPDTVEPASTQETPDGVLPAGEGTHEPETPEQNSDVDGGQSGDVEIAGDDLAPVETKEPPGPQLTEDYAEPAIAQPDDGVPGDGDPGEGQTSAVEPRIEGPGRSALERLEDDGGRVSPPGASSEPPTQQEKSGNWPLEQREGATDVVFSVGDPSPRALNLSWTWWLSLLPAVGIVVGAFMVSRGLGVIEALAAVGGAGVLAAIVTTGLGAVASRSGTSVVALGGATFGRAGNIPVSAILALVQSALVAVVILAATNIVSRVLGLSGVWPLQNWVAEAAIALVLTTAVVALGMLGSRVIRVALYASAGVALVGAAGIVAVTWNLLAPEELGAWSSAAYSPIALGSIVFAGALALVGFGVSPLGHSGAGPGARALSRGAAIAAPLVVLGFVTYVAWVSASAPLLAITLVTDPVGALSAEMPPWYPVPLALALGLPLVGLGALLLRSARESVGLVAPAPRPLGAVLVGVLVVAGVAAVIAFDYPLASNFPGVVYLVGVVLAAWMGALVVDATLGRGRFDSALAGDTVAMRIAPLAGVVLAIGLGWGLLSSQVSWLVWTGYLFPVLEALGLIDLSPAQPGVVVALVVSAVVSAIAAVARRSRTPEVVDG